MRQNQYRRLSAVIVFALLTLASPTRAAPVPSAEEDGLGHFLGCFSVLLDSAVHAKYCGPSSVPLDLTPLGAGSDNSAPPPPPPSCAPCTGGAFVDLPALEPYQVASLSYGMLPVATKPERWELLMACCPASGA
jgi:hypothetical protein